VQLSVASPVEEYRRWAGRTELSSVRYLGWLTRPELWREFTRHDLLVVPSLALEAFALVAVEAQACGLPVAYHAVPGLSEVLRNSAFAVDAERPDGLALLVKSLQTNPARLDEARWAGTENSARFPLSATAASLHRLSTELAG
jgi:glycosyltransferase involved in cell wall biosynthesis